MTFEKVDEIFCLSTERELESGAVMGHLFSQILCGHADDVSGCESCFLSLRQHVLQICCTVRDRFFIIF